MSCSEFMDDFSAFVDGVASASVAAAAEAHLASCERCRRYEEIYRRGVRLLRSFPDVAVDDHFRPELEVRLRRDTAAALERLGTRPPASNSPLALVLGMAVILVGVAWVPFLLEDRGEEIAQVELEPLVAAYPTREMAGALPEIRLLDRRTAASPYRRTATSPYRRASLTAGGLFEESSSLLREYAPVMRGYAVGPGGTLVLE